MQSACAILYYHLFYTLCHKRRDFRTKSLNIKCVTLFDLQLDVQILIYLHIIHLLKSCTCFDHYPAHLQEVYVVIVYMQPLVLSLSAGDCLVHRSRKNFLDRCTRQTPAKSDDTRGCICTITT